MESAKPYPAKPESDKTGKRNLLNHTLPDRNILNPKSGICQTYPAKPESAKLWCGGPGGSVRAAWAEALGRPGRKR